MPDLTAAVYLGLGANVGNRLANLRVALARMRTFARLEAVSRLYETAPVGLQEQPAFLNAACRLTTGLEPAALLRFLKNLEMLRRLAELRVLGRPILIGTSRKSTIGKVLGLPVEERLEGTAATVAVAIAHGADIVRVHDVKAMVRVAQMTDAIVRASGA